MGKRGPKPKQLISETWNSNLAYAIGLIATDGCLLKSAPLIDVTSKDEEQLKNFSKAISYELKIGKKKSGVGNEYLRVQFKSVLFYNFLLSLGLTPAKSKTMGRLNIPREYFFDFLRGAADGDGSFYSYWDPRWRSSFMYYLVFVSASVEFVKWLQDTINAELGVKGHVTFNTRSHFQLRYAKADSLKIMQKMYHAPDVICLSRKRLKIEKALSIVGEHL